jgi:hypothetical protein
MTSEGEVSASKNAFTGFPFDGTTGNGSPLIVFRTLIGKFDKKL